MKTKHAVALGALIALLGTPTIAQSQTSFDTLWGNSTQRPSKPKRSMYERNPNPSYAPRYDSQDSPRSNPQGRTVSPYIRAPAFLWQIPQGETHEQPRHAEPAIRPKALWLDNVSVSSSEKRNCTELEAIVSLEKRSEPGFFVPIRISYQDLQATTNAEKFHLKIANQSYSGADLSKAKQLIYDFSKGALREKIVDALSSAPALRDKRALLFGSVLDAYVDAISRQMDSGQETKDYCLKIPNRFLQASMKISAEISKSQKKLTFYQHIDDEKYILFQTGVAIGGFHYDKAGRGRVYASPEGTWYLSRIVKNPTWFPPPAWAAVSSPQYDERSPLFGYAMELTKKSQSLAEVYGQRNGLMDGEQGYNGIMIHGTKDILSIRKAKSRGCFRVAGPPIYDLASGLSRYAFMGISEQRQRGTIFPLSENIPVTISK